MSLPHVLLGLLHAEPRTGYDLGRAMAEEIDPAWSAGLSQIYPALARLRRNGWVRLRTLGPRRGPPRLLYRVTAAGRRELQRWLAATPPAPRGNDAFLARIALLEALPPAARRTVQSALAAALDAEAVRLEALPDPGGTRGFARRAAAAQRRALARFLEGPGTGRPPARPRPGSPQKPGRGPRRTYDR